MKKRTFDPGLMKTTGFPTLEQVISGMLKRVKRELRRKDSRILRVHNVGVYRITEIKGDRLVFDMRASELQPFVHRSNWYRRDHRVGDVVRIVRSVTKYSHAYHTVSITA